MIAAAAYVGTRTNTSSTNEYPYDDTSSATASSCWYSFPTCFPEPDFDALERLRRLEAYKSSRNWKKAPVTLKPVSLAYARRLILLRRKHGKRGWTGRNFTKHPN